MDPTFPRSEALGDTARQNDCGSLKIVKRILKNSVTIMTYLKILKKMPDQYCPDSDALRKST